MAKCAKEACYNNGKKSNEGPFGQVSCDGNGILRCSKFESGQPRGDN